MDDAESELVKLGAEIWVTPAVAEDVRDDLREAVDEIVERYADDVIDWGRD